MIGDWAIHHLPRCTHQVFLSHCAEDRDRLVVPVYNALENAEYFPWLDKHHYPVGQGAFEALREGILHCRHIVYFVTSRFLSQVTFSIFGTVSRPISFVLCAARPCDSSEIRVGAARSPWSALFVGSCRQCRCGLGDAGDHGVHPARRTTRGVSGRTDSGRSWFSALAGC